MKPTVALEAAIENVCRLISSVEAEQALIGALLVHNSVFDQIAGAVAADDFSEEIHRRIFDVAAALITSGRPATPQTLKTYLGDHNLGGQSIGGYLASLCADAMPPLLAKGYAAEIRNLATRRRLASYGGELIGRSADAPVGTTASCIAGEAISALHEIAGGEGAASRIEVHEGLAEVIANIQAVQSGEVVRRQITTGFVELDGATQGYQPGALWIVAARPGVGKTVFAATSANKVASTGAGVLLFSLEVSRPQMLARLAADLTYDDRRPISFASIINSQLNPDEMRRVEAAYERFERMPLVLDTASRLTTAEIRMRVRAEKERMAAKGVPLAVVFIDYLKQIQSSDRYHGKKVYEIGETSAALKQLAKDEGICVVLLSQVNRTVESQEDKRPTLANLRDSGDLEMDADVVAFVHREAYFIESSADFRSGEADATNRFYEEEHKAELILGKNRIGPTKTISLWCDVSCSVMTSMANSAFLPDRRAA